MKTVPRTVDTRTFVALAAVYFGSGFVALVDEVVFSKYLSLVFGATAQASSAVLVAYMGGLALGAVLAARFERNVARPAWLYGVLEVVVGVVCLVVPSLFGGLTKIYVALASGASSLVVLEVLRGGVAAAVVLLPTTAMGATLPLMAKAVAPVAGKGDSRRLAVLYGLNTAGGALGSLVSAYAMLPAWGLSTTLRLAGLGSAVLGLVAIAFGRGLVRTDEGSTSEATSAPRPRIDRDVALAAAVSGAFVFVAEVVFVHLFALVVGTSVYAFGVVLFVFLVCLSVGAELAPVLRRVAKEDAFATSAALTATTLAASLPLWDRTPAVFEALGPAVLSWPGREAVRALVAFGLCVLPVTSMGTLFPLALLELGDRTGAGATVGRVTALNTASAIVGSLSGGFVALPLLGSEGSLRALVVVYAAVAVVLAVPSIRAGRRPVVAGVLVAVAAVAWIAVPRWDLARITSGTNVYFAKADEGVVVQEIHEDVHGGVTTVSKIMGVTTLLTNGKFQGDDGFQVAAQRGFAHVPALFVHEDRRALVIGLGTGMTLGTLATYPFERIDLAELSPGIVDAARKYFGRINRDVLADPRVHVLLEDGRNVLLVGSAKYDLVTIELTSVWFAGAGNLYNREFYAIAKARLSESGILQQWVQLHHTTEDVIASQMATVRSEFAHVRFFSRGDQGFLVASERPLVVDDARLRALEARPALHDTLGDAASLREYGESQVFDERQLDAFVDAVARRRGVPRESLVSTDDNLRIEYDTPRNNVPGMPSIDATLRALEASKTAP